MSPTESVLEMSDVSVAYGASVVFSDVSLSIRQGEVYALLGPNGAGKTTLIRSLLGRVQPSRGSIFIAPSGVGLVPQQTALFPALTIRENLIAFARLVGLTRSETLPRIDAVIADLALADRVHQPVSTLSGGWQRRVNIAVAMLNKPALLILDEPTVGVDKAARDGFHEILKQLAASGSAILITTHDLAEAEAVCSHALFLKDGRSIAMGSIPELMRNAFAGRYRVSVETQQSSTAKDRATIAEFGLTLRNGDRADAMLPRDQALELISTLSNQLVTLRRAGVEQPGLHTLYHHFIDGPSCLSQS